MQTPTLPADGRCRCGAIVMRITKMPLFTAACHCRGCQRMTASAFSLSMAIPDDGVSITKGAAVLDDRNPAAGHHFCATCRTWLFTKAEMMPGFTNVRPTMLDDPSWFVPFIETCTDEMLPFAKTGAPHSFAGFPPAEAYAELLSAYPKAMGAS